ncbi:VanW family protein [Paenibacillus agricola]|uniref:Uncharacterized protein n=1 Tax=Paenibacillus agricola TaxID=2716264 RepID=A0ABX0J1M4_9BACL|nr:VanW family protein [Paenibacillus agricola]NHN29583.1 hypothetical protein [Paenibacillus agricola]
MRASRKSTRSGRWGKSARPRKIGIKLGLKGQKIMVCLGAIVVITGMGTVLCKGGIWEAGTLSAEANTTVMEAASKLETLMSFVIQNVTSEKVDDSLPIVEVAGAVKVDEGQKAFFNKLNQLELKPQKQFVYSEWFAAVEPQLSEKPTEATYSYLASLLYEAAIKSGLQAGARHLHQQLPEYASPGFDVFVRPGRNDLSLYNPKPISAKVTVTYTDDVPHITLFALSSAGWKAVQISVKQTYYKPESVHILDRSLALAGEVTQQAGQAGQLIEVVVGEKLLTKDFYLPSPTIIGHGAMPDELAAAYPARLKMD